MTQILIDEISYKNFKGFKDFTLTLNSQNAIVCGRNGVGKTSLADGFQWLLFGKDTQGMKLNPKPVDPNNQELLGLEPEVEAQLLIEGETVTLKRIQKEKWTTKKGDLEKVRSSDTMKYYINDVPKKEKEWKEYLEDLGGEAKLQMLSNAAFFMSLNWKQRRETLLEMSGLTDDEIIKSDETLSELIEILGDKSVDEMKLILAGQKKQVKEDINGIPARIQEVTDIIERTRPDRDRATTQEAIAFYKSEIETKEAKIAGIDQVDPTLTIKQEIAELDLEIANEKNKFLATANLATQNLQDDVRKQQDKVNYLRREVQDLESKEYRLEQAIKEKEEFRSMKIAEYKEIKSITFSDHQTECPTCGQELPADQIEDMRNKFNLDKAQRLEANIASVEAQKATKEDMASLREELAQVKSVLPLKQVELKNETDQLNRIDQELVFEQQRVGTFEKSEVFFSLTNKKNQLLKAIEEAVKQKGEIQVVRLKQEILEDKENLKALEKLDLTFDSIKELELRVSELMEEDTRLKAQNLEIERQLWLIDEFTRKKVEKIEESINQKFKIVKWKLFRIQQNGGIEEKCEAMMHGVEYSQGLSNGERAQVDIDIINALFAGTGHQLPIFLDNAESITEPYQLNGQIIELFAKENIENLKVEV